MEKVHVLLANRQVVAEISSSDFNNIYFIVDSLNDFEKIHMLYRLTKKSSEDFNKFISEQRVQNELLNLDELKFEGLDKSLKYIMFSRMFFENLAIFDTSLKKIYDKEEENNKYFKILRLLRNYAQHYSIPISDVSKTSDILIGEITGAELYIWTQDLLKKGFKPEDIDFITNNFPNKVIINELITEIDIELEKFFNRVLDITYDYFEIKFISFHNKYLELMKMIPIDSISYADKICIEEGTYYKYQENYERFDRQTYELFLSKYLEYK